MNNCTADVVAKNTGGNESSTDRCTTAGEDDGGGAST
jgi:hypothetical protein